MRLSLIRHATSEHGAGFDNGLTSSGKVEVKRLKRSRILGNADTIFCSPSRRVHHTCELLFPEAVAAVVDFRLREMNDSYPPDWPALPHESFDMFVGRVRSYLDDVAELQNASTVAAVTHAGVVVASMVSLLGLPDPRARARLEPEFASVTVFERNAGVWTLVTYNVTA